MGFPRPESWGRVSFPSPGGLPDPGIEPAYPVVPELQAAGGFFAIEPAGKPMYNINESQNTDDERKKPTQEMLQGALEQAKLIYGHRIQKSVTSGGGKEGSGGGDNWEGGVRNVWGGQVWDLDGVCVTEAYAFVKIQGQLYLGFVHFTMCNLY